MKRVVDHIILFDGTCNLCNATVQFIIKRDPKGRFAFASLQSHAGKELLRQHSLGNTVPDAVVLLSGGKIFLASDAVLRIFRQFSGPWRFLSFFLIIPRPIRDFFYRFIARYRFRLFGTRAVCMHSLPGWEERFLE
ncbi:MAG: thiol-disulfide oxidoreductase DCC family protein [Chitinophagia bacterium]|nr:thiol-disulfide oxidoreductase DCC family protein [Chitinophagia bacterium]